MVTLAPLPSSTSFPDKVPSPKQNPSYLVPSQRSPSTLASAELSGNHLLWLKFALGGVCQAQDATGLETPYTKEVSSQWLGSGVSNPQSWTEGSIPEGGHKGQVFQSQL